MRPVMIENIQSRQSSDFMSVFLGNAPYTAVSDELLVEISSDWCNAVVSFGVYGDDPTPFKLFSLGQRLRARRLQIRGLMGDLKLR